MIYSLLILLILFDGRDGTRYENLRVKSVAGILINVSKKEDIRIMLEFTNRYHLYGIKSLVKDMS